MGYLLVLWDFDTAKSVDITPAKNDLYRPLNLINTIDTEPYYKPLHLKPVSIHLQATLLLPLVLEVARSYRNNDDFNAIHSLVVKQKSRWKYVHIDPIKTINTIKAINSTPYII